MNKGNEDGMRRFIWSIFSNQTNGHRPSWRNIHKLLFYRNTQNNMIIRYRAIFKTKTYHAKHFGICFPSFLGNFVKNMKQMFLRIKNVHSPIFDQSWHIGLWSSQPKVKYKFSKELRVKAISLLPDGSCVSGTKLTTLVAARETNDY